LASYCFATASVHEADGARRCRDIRRALFIGANPMNFFYGLAAVIAVALTVYLCVALLKPEWFE
jgi:K+-transporting ATPase KdpF subunit